MPKKHEKNQNQLKNSYFDRIYERKRGELSADTTVSGFCTGL